MITPAEKASVLVVDDNPLIVNVLKSLLTAAEYQVFTCNDGREAAELLDTKRVDVIICDVMMPAMDGYELHETVRGKAELSHIPFIFLTALDDNLEILKGKESGADDYLVKPFDPRELLSIVKGKIKRSHGLRHMSEERYDQYRKKVIHTLSHEFRTPLVAINTGTELLIEQQHSLDENKAQNLLEAVRRGGQRLERLVNDFMVLQQIEAGIARRMHDSRAGVLSVSKMVKDFLESRAELLERQKSQLTLVDRAEGVTAKIYETQILDVMDRLLSNALKFRGTDNSLEIHIYPLEHEVAIEFRDRGIGIDPERIKEAVDVFGQIDRDRLEQQGGGLGLAIASRYAALNGGRLEFERRNGGGAVVTLFLPLHSR